MKTFYIIDIIFGVSYGYIDPGSGSIIIQMILGAIAGAAVGIKLYWFKLKSFFVRKKPKAESVEESKSAEDDRKAS